MDDEEDAAMVVDVERNCLPNYGQHAHQQTAAGASVVQGLGLDSCALGFSNDVDIPVCRRHTLRTELWVGHAR